MKGSSMRTRTLSILAVVGLTALFGCPRPNEAPTQASAPARILSFSASHAVVPAGTTVTLSWEAKDATTLHLRDARKGVMSGVDASKASGSLPVTITEDTLFVLDAGNARGQLDSAAISVRVQSGADEVVFAASPHRISPGDPVVLAWVADDAREVSLTDGAGQTIDLGGQLETGSVRVNPNVDTVYALKVDGKNHHAQVKVRPIIRAFITTPASATAGEPLTLSWQTVGATEVTLSRGGVGQLHSETDAAKVTDGAFEVTVPGNARAADVLTFELLARGAEVDSTTSARVEVYIAGAPKVRAWNVPAYAKIGSTFEVSWRTSGADLIEILEDGLVIYTSPSTATAVQGSVRLPSPTADAKYQLRARDFRGGVALSEEQNVNPVGKPTVDVFTATPSSIPFGGDAVTLTWNVPYARTLYILANGELLVHGARGVGVGVASITAYPNEDTVYELRADNGAGDSVSATAQVTVATPVGLTWTPTRAPLGMAVELTGTTLGGSGDLVGLPWVNVGKGAFIPVGKAAGRVTDDGTGSESQIFELPKTFRGTQFGLPFSATHLNVSVNGWFSFGGTRIEGAPRPTRAGLAADLPPGAIAPFFDGLMNVRGDIFVEVEELSPTDQRLIVQWSNVQHEDGPFFDSLEFQAQVYSDGRVVFAYNSIVHGGAATPSVGLVDPFGATVLETLHDPSTGDVASFYEPLTPPITLNTNALPYTLRAARTGGFLQIHEAFPFIPPDQFEIAEINVNPPAGVSNGQWFEVLNKTAAPIDLSGWTLDLGAGSTHTITAASLPPNGRLLFGQSATAGDGVSVDYVYGSGLAFGPGDQLGFSFNGGRYTSLELPPWPLAPGYSWQVGDAAPGLMVEPSVRSLACAARSSSTYGSHGQHGTPGAVNTPCMTYGPPQSIPNDYQPIETTGTRLTFGGRDEGLEAVTPSSPINLMHIPISSLTVSTHGFATPYPLTCPLPPEPCYGESKEVLDRRAQPYGLIAPFWDALHDYSFLGGTGGVFWEHRDPDATPGSGDEVTIVSWERMGRSIRDRLDDRINAQVKFFADGTIEFHYGDILEGDLFNNPFGGLWASSWLEDPMGTSAWVINSHTHFPGIHPFTAYRFTLQ